MKKRTFKINIKSSVRSDTVLTPPPPPPTPPAIQKSRAPLPARPSRVSPTRGGNKQLPASENPLGLDVEFKQRADPFAVRALLGASKTLSAKVDEKKLHTTLSGQHAELAPSTRLSIIHNSYKH